MDIVLEILDTFAFDRLYALAIPNSAPHQSWLSTTVRNGTTSTLSSMREGATALPSYEYKPATQYFSLEPSKYAYMSQLPRDNIYRQWISLFLTGWIFGLLVYLVFSGLSYVFVFDKDTFKHPKFLKNQVKLEIMQTIQAIPLMALLTAPFFLAEVRGYAKLYDTPADAPFSLYNYVQYPFFILFTDFFIYWIHRGLHHPLIYKRLHKTHHKWIMPTPFASHAFHPADGFAQSLPYHAFPFIFPLQKVAYIALFVFVNFWTILIHDGEYVANSSVINGAACHSLHHSKFEVNYGQFTTLWDRIGKTYFRPPNEMFNIKAKKKE